ETWAVVGGDVPVALLGTVAELPDAVLHQGLHHLQAAEFLYETRLFPELAYTFKHALTHEVAYGSLLQERRRALHVRIVEALETLASDRRDEQVELLAQHAVRGQVWEKAVRYLHRAGIKASGRSTYREAVAYLEQALEALHSLPEQCDTRAQAIDLRLTLRDALAALGELDRVTEVVREAERLAEGLDDAQRLGQVSLLLSADRFWMGEYDRAIAIGQRVLTLA